MFSKNLIFMNIQNIQKNFCNLNTRLLNTIGRAFSRQTKIERG